MLRLGHIDYSNCVPVHAALLHGAAAGLEIMHGTPAQLNEALAGGRIDVAPCSSIEYAHHASEYRLLPGLVIGSDGPVQSIRFESHRPIQELGAARVALPSASASSVVLLRILLERRFRAKPVYEWYAQESGADPLELGFDAALWIGDIALRRPPNERRSIYDLGALWKEWTGLPFAFALWQTRLGAERDAELLQLAARLHASRAATLADSIGYARRYAASLGLSAAQLADYWRGLRYELDAPMLAGLQRFYTHAFELAEIPRVPELRFVC